MPTCSCGNAADGAGDFCARCAALQTLELPQDATDKEVKEAYRVLVKVWHPDRFHGDEKLKQAADEKLKALNSAYLFLTSRAGSAQRRRQQAKRPQPEASASQKMDPQAHAQPIRRRQLRLPTGTLLKLAVIACILLVGWFILSALDSFLASDPATGPIYSELRVGVKERFHEGMESLWSETGARLHALVPRKGGSASQNPDDAHPAPVNLRPYITAGLTQQEVIAVLGTPTSSSESELTYGPSDLEFTNGNLSGWNIAASSPIRVKLWPDAPVNPKLASFKIGSTKNEVLVVQGTPSYFSDAMFGYGGSVVYFVNGRVASWKNDPTTVPLRVASR